MSTRLDSIAPELVARITGASPQQQRRIAVEAASLAVTAVGLHNPATEHALRVLRAGGLDSQVRQAVEQLVEQLDETAWDLQEQAEGGRAEQAAYQQAFQRARAASSLAFALADDPQAAALEGVYEAEAATTDLAQVTRIVADIAPETT